MQEEFRQGIQEAKDKYFSAIDPKAGTDVVSMEAVNMKGFIDGLTQAYNIEPDYEGESE